ncbi:hypothetical protein HOLleu_31783 [Holothuria leucospilota]|uniref:CCHC-type domain-containing protein n=1 Tax=Holothuria leucospilota TaxID=206669 RepID=A0A9Q0YQW3_HOLLE|nr:hypothetical protein HOLleu_31783 [Holothuria leucospilota]
MSCDTCHTSHNILGTCHMPCNILGTCQMPCNILGTCQMPCNILGTCQMPQNMLRTCHTLSVCNRDMSIFIREREPKTFKDLTTVAERYSIVHGRLTDSKTDSGKRKNQTHQNSGNWSNQPNLGSNSRVNNSANSLHCFVCGKRGHMARNCRQRYCQTAQTSRTAALELDNQIESIEITETKQEEPQHTVNACLGICTNECGIVSPNTNAVKLLCGHEIPMISVAATESNKMPVSSGFIGDREVSVLRDSGCSTIVIRRSLVGDEQLTGNVRKCILLDGTVRDVPEALVCVDTPFYIGKGFVHE